MVFETKMLLERSVAFRPDVLHVLAGAAVAVVAALILRTSLSTWRPWLVTLAATLANEAMDLAVDRWLSPRAQLGECLRDLILTMAVPSLLLAGIRAMPGLFAPASPRKSDG